MQSQFPGIKVIFLLRHPVERAISNYRFSVARGREALSFTEAIRREERREARGDSTLPSGSPFAYVRRGRYAPLLYQFLDVFPPEQRMIALTEDLASRPFELRHRLFEFLGVGPSPSVARAARIENASPGDDLRISRATIDYLFSLFENDNRQLEGILGRRIPVWSEVTPYLERLLNS